nr:MAG: hypothetical protein EDM05_35630 [Leptolyngbya sp. IPPAS B-1204]
MYNRFWFAEQPMVSTAKPRVMSPQATPLQSGLRNLVWRYALLLLGAGLVAAPCIWRDWMQQQKLALATQAAEVQQQLERDPFMGLVAAVDAVGQNRSRLPQLLPAVQANLLTAVQTAKERYRLTLNHPISTLRFSPDQQTLAIGLQSGNAVLWSRQGSQQVLSGNGVAIGSMEFSPDGQILLANPAAATGQIQRWPLTEEMSWQRPDWARMTAAAFSADGQSLITGSNGGNVRLWTRQGEWIGRLDPPHQGAVTAVASQAATLVSAGEDGRIYLWNAKGERLGYLWAGAKVSAMRVSQSGQRIFVADQQRHQVFLWNEAAGQWSQFLLGQTPRVRSADLSADNALVAQGLTNGTIQLSPLAAPASALPAQPLRGHSGAVTTVLFSPDQQTLVSGGSDGTVRLWDVADGTLITRFHLQEWSAQPLQTVALSPDGNQIAIRDGSGQIQIRNRHQQRLAAIEGPAQSALHLRWSADSQTLAVQSGSSLSLWNLNGEVVRRITLARQHPLDSFALSPTGEHLLTVSSAGMQLWHLPAPDKPEQSGQALGQPVYLTQVPHYIAVSPDGRYAVSGWASTDSPSGTPNGQTCLWQITPPLSSPACQPLASHTALFSPDGQTVMIGAADGRLQEWNRQGQSLQTLAMHAAPITAIALTADGQTLVSGSADGTLQLNDRHGNRIGHPLVGHQSAIAAIAVHEAKGEKTIVSLSQDREVRLWQGDWRSWLATACRRIQHHPLVQSPVTETQRRAQAVCASMPPLPVAVTAPLAPAAKPAATIRLVVQLSQRRVQVYEGEQVKASYPVAVGQAGWETPTGQFQVFQMLQQPGWTHPLTDAAVPAGANNPLGERWIGFWSDGHQAIGFHGTPDPASVGTAASHGCLRMYNEDVRALYDWVQLGTPVTVEP